MRGVFAFFAIEKELPLCAAQDQRDSIVGGGVAEPTLNRRRDVDQQEVVQAGAGD
jgi:hypothetical protein